MFTTLPHEIYDIIVNFMLDPLQFSRINSDCHNFFVEYARLSHRHRFRANGKMTRCDLKNYVINVTINVTGPPLGDISKIFVNLRYLTCEFYEWNNKVPMVLRLHPKSPNITDKSISGLSKLYQLNCNWCKNITDVGISALKYSLTVLYCKGCIYITDRGLLELKCLRILSCPRCPMITDVGISELQYLISLSCEHNQKITDISISILQYLKYLNCGYCKWITDEGIQKMTNLIELHSDQCPKITRKSSTKCMKNARRLLKN